MTIGEQIYFNKINAQGGILGKKLKLLVYDDAYEPQLTAINMRRLITEDKVLAVIGNVGSPNAMVAVPIANELKTLLYGTFSGALVLRKQPPDRYVFNFRASYAEETAAIIKGLLKIGVKPTEIAFFAQNDAFGDYGYEGAIKALQTMGYPIKKLPHVRFTRNTLNVEEGLAELLDLPEKPKAIIILAPYLPAAKFISLALKDMPNTFFVGVSFVGSDALRQELGSQGENRVIVTQVVPDFRANLPAVKEYRDTLKKYAPKMKPGVISLEGFLASKLFILSLKKAAKSNNLTREGIVQALEGMKNVDIGIGIPISFDKTHHQALHQVWPTILKKGSFVPFNWEELNIVQKNNKK
jgi:ABC-type branched-subunit amino acid transport system substrate-binding protein